MPVDVSSAQPVSVEGSKEVADLSCGDRRRAPIAERGHDSAGARPAAMRFVRLPQQEHVIDDRRWLAPRTSASHSSHCVPSSQTLTAASAAFSRSVSLRAISRAWSAIAATAATFAARSSSQPAGQRRRRLRHAPDLSCSCHVSPRRGWTSFTARGRSRDPATSHPSTPCQRRLHALGQRGSSAGPTRRP